jgi:integrase
MTRPTKHPKTGFYWIRKGVPKALRVVVGKRELIRSLGTKDCAVAKRLAPPVLTEFETILARARGEAVAAVVARPVIAVQTAEGAVPMQAASKPKRRAEPRIASEALIDAWSAEAQPSQATLQKYRGVFRQIARILGFDDVNRIGVDEVVKFKEARFAEGRNAKTVVDDVIAAGTVCKWGVKNRKIAANPFVGMAAKRNRRGPPPVIKYDDDEAKRILTAARDETGWLRWVPWLMAFTGARISELADMRRRDVRQDSGVMILDIVPTDERAGKNDTMQRMIPLHPAVIAEGFLDYVANLPPDPSGPLFPSITASMNGSRAANAQARHGLWLRDTVKITDPRKAPAHSWRHRMEDELRKVRALPEVQDAITGHKNPRNAGAGYGDGFRGMPDEVLKELRKIPSPLDDAATASAAESHEKWLARIAREFYDHELRLDAEERRAANGQSTRAFLQKGGFVEVNEGIARRGLGFGNEDGRVLVADFADTICVREGIPRTGQDRLALDQALLRALVEVQKRARERDSGDFSGKPSDPLILHNEDNRR